MSWTWWRLPRAAPFPWMEIRQGVCHRWNLDRDVCEPLWGSFQIEQAVPAPILVPHPADLAGLAFER